MVLIDFEGFDYEDNESGGASGSFTIGFANGDLANWGGVNSGGNKVSSLLSGFAMQFTSNTGRVNRSGFGNLATIIIGGRHQYTLINTLNDFLRFYDGATVQCGFSINASNQIIFWRGTNATILATGTRVLTTSSWFQFECKVTINNTTGSVEWRLDQTVDGSGSSLNTRNSANNYLNKVEWGNSASGNMWADDLYICDTTGSVANDYLGNVRAETLFPANVVSTATTPSAGTAIGIYNSAGPGSSTQAANNICFMPFTPTNGGTLTDVITKIRQNLTGKINAALYDSSGAGGGPGALIAATTEVVNPSGNATYSLAPAVTLTFSSPPTVLAGTLYYVAIATDTLYNAFRNPGSTANCYNAASTYASGFPANTSALTLSGSTQMLWSEVDSNLQVALMVSEVTKDNDTTYNNSSSSGDIDLFTVNPLSSTPVTIYGVKVLAAARKDDTTMQTIRTKLKSGATTQNGASHTDVNTRYTYFQDMYVTDPNTGSAWAGSAVNAANIGYEHV